ncbi:MAG TPA: hypothetical protein VMU87_18155 [Stellaceae bacterium]|nr:hypothetical protein [Stellaceae bacterium]
MAGIDPSDLLHRVIRPTLSTLGLDGPDADALLLATAAQESGCGDRLAQLAGPALGLWQMEPATHGDIIGNFLGTRPTLARAVAALALPAMTRVEQLAGNLYYACAMARLVYRRAPAPLPPWNDADAQARYWKDHYNTPRGAGTVEQFLASRRTIAGALA